MQGGHWTVQSPHQPNTHIIAASTGDSEHLDCDISCSTSAASQPPSRAVAGASASEEVVVDLVEDLRGGFCRDHRGVDDLPGGGGDAEHLGGFDCQSSTLTLGPASRRTAGTLVSQNPSAVMARYDSPSTCLSSAPSWRVPMVTHHSSRSARHGRWPHELALQRDDHKRDVRSRHRCQDGARCRQAGATPREHRSESRRGAHRCIHGQQRRRHLSSSASEMCGVGNETISLDVNFDGCGGSHDQAPWLSRPMALRSPALFSAHDAGDADSTR